MNKEFYEKSIASLLLQVEKLKEERDFYKEQSDDFKQAYINACYDLQKGEKYSLKLEQDVSELYGKIHNLKEELRTVRQENEVLVHNFLKNI